MIAILLDQGFAPRAAAILRDRTFDAVHVMEIAIANSDDEAIWKLPELKSHLCDVASRLSHSSCNDWRGSSSVILLRIAGLGAEAQADVIDSLCRQCHTALVEGAANSADGIADSSFATAVRFGKVRCRQLVELSA